MPLNGKEMLDSRTTKVLGALLISMTLGALILMLLENKSPRPQSFNMASIVSKVVDKSWANSNEDQRWQKIVVHTSADAKEPTQRCHFIINEKPVKGSWVTATNLWKNQLPGRHTYFRDFQHSSIGICVIGDFSSKRMHPDQFKALITLVHHLQRTGGILEHNIFFQSDVLSKYPKCGLFPTEQFQNQLLKN